MGRWHRLLSLVSGASLTLAAAALAGCDADQSREVRVLAIGDRQPRLVDPSTASAKPSDLLLIAEAAQGLVRFDAAGNIAPGLAERWAVSDDGLSYVFRLRSAKWSDGRRVRAREVARLIERQRTARGRNPLGDTLGAISQVVAMTDRVIAIELSAPRPHLLQLLAQPEFGLVRERQGTGPFAIERKEEGLVLTRTLPGFEDEAETRERVLLDAEPADRAIAAFAAGKADVVLGGTSGDLPLARRARLPGGALRVDPVAGVFGLLPLRRLALDREVRELLDQALDRQALVAALGLQQLGPRTSILQPGLDGIAAPSQPAWASIPLAVRRPELIARARQLFPPAGEGERGSADRAQAGQRATVRVAVPSGPGGEIIITRLQEDWAPLGLTVVASNDARADFRWVDAVAPSTSPAWFLRSFRCGVAPLCLREADRLLEAARLAGFAPQRNAFFAEAERQMRDAVLFIPVASPVRWSLTARGIDGFVENRFGHHTLSDLRERPAARN